MYKWKWVGWLGIMTTLGGCVSQSYLFQTPHDRMLRKALQRSRIGWVSHGQDTLIQQPNRLFPGQFVRVIVEGPLFQPEESKGEWSIIRVDTFRIQSDSLAYLPWIGSFFVGGLSLDSAHILLNELARRVYREAKVKLYPLYPVYLLGAVPQPGLLLFENPYIRFIDLMPYMGTSQRQSNYREIKIVRGQLSDPYIILADIRKCSVLDTLYLRPSDIVYVPPRKIQVISENVQIFTIAFTILQALNFILIFRANLLR